MSAGLSPRQTLRYPPPPCFADGLAGVAAWSARGRAIEQWKEFLIQAATEIGFVVAATRYQRTEHEREDETRLGKLARPEPGVVAAGLGVGVSGDPLPVVATQFSKIVVPMGAKAKGIADESAQKRALGAVLQGRSQHTDLLQKSLARSGVGATTIARIVPL